MKKLKNIFAVIVSIMMLTGCAHTDKLPQPKDTGNFDLTPRSVEQLDQLINDLGTEDFLSDAERSKLEGRGITVDLSDVIRMDYDTVFYRLNLKNKEGGTIVLDNTAKLFYQWWPMNTEYFNLMAVNHSNITVTQDVLIHTTLDDVAVYDAATLKKEKVKFDLSFLKDTGYLLLDTAQTKNGYVTAYYSDIRQGFAFFDTDGKLIKNVTFEEHKNGAVFGTQNSKEKKEKYMFNLDWELISIRDMIFTDDSERYLLVLSGKEYGNMLYDFEKDIAYRLFNMTFYAENTPIELYSSYVYPGYRHKNGDDCVVAVNNTNGIVADTMVYEDMHLYAFPVKDIICSTNGDVRQVIADSVEMKTTLDFATDTATVDFRLDDSYFKNEINRSADGRYAVYTVTEGFGSSALAVKDNHSGKIKYIGHRGVLYGTSYGQAGFLKNNDVFLLTDNSYRIWSADSDSSQPQFSLGRYFPLGDDASSGVRLRHLAAVLRDDENQRYIIAYYDLPDGMYQSDWYADAQNSQLKYNYRIAVMDYNGDIAAEYETDMNAYMARHPVYLSLNGNNLYIEVHSQTDGTTVTGKYISLE